MNEGNSNAIKISKKQLWKYSTFLLLGVILVGGVFFSFSGMSPTLTGNAVAGGFGETVEVRTVIEGFKKAGFFGTMGVFLAALAPGCAACGIGLISALGLSAAFLTFFPFEGLELSILAIGILSFSIYKITKDMEECRACQIKLTNQKMKGGMKNG